MTYAPMHVKVKASNHQMCRISLRHPVSFLFFFDQDRSERDAPLKQDMVDVVGWISDVQKVAMIPKKMSDVAPPLETIGRRQAGGRQAEGSKATVRRHVLGSFEEISPISPISPSARESERRDGISHCMRLERKSCPRQRPAVTRCCSRAAP